MTKKRGFNAQRYLLAGVLTVIPIWITWFVFDFIIRQLSKLGEPWIRAISRSMEPHAPVIAEWLTAPALKSVLGVILTILALYLLGFFASRVVGKRIILGVESLIDRIPYVKKVYNGVKTLTEALQQKPHSLERVVLVEFPSPHMKTVGFVTKILIDQSSGRELAAVYVPTTPNPTSGYIEIVPIERLVSTNWSVDEAMTFIISGGTVSPGAVHYSKPASEPVQTSSNIGKLDAESQSANPDPDT